MFNRKKPHCHYYRNGEYFDHGRYIFDKKPNRGDIIAPFRNNAGDIKFRVLSIELDDDVFKIEIETVE